MIIESRKLYGGNNKFWIKSNYQKGKSLNWHFRIKPENIKIHKKDTKIKTKR